MKSTKKVRERRMVTEEQRKVALAMCQEIILLHPEFEMGDVLAALPPAIKKLYADNRAALGIVYRVAAAMITKAAKKAMRAQPATPVIDVMEAKPKRTRKSRLTKRAAATEAIKKQVRYEVATALVTLGPAERSTPNTKIASWIPRGLRKSYEYRGLSIQHTIAGMRTHLRRGTLKLEGDNGASAVQVVACSSHKQTVPKKVVLDDRLQRDIDAVYNTARAKVVDDGKQALEQANAQGADTKTLLGILGETAERLVSLASSKEVVREQITACMTAAIKPCGVREF